ncbi:MAG: hypothetical protein ACF787_13795, partial [Rhodopirellula sp. JB053]
MRQNLLLPTSGGRRSQRVTATSDHPMVASQILHVFVLVEVCDVSLVSGFVLMKNVFEQWTSASLGEVTMVVLSSVVIYAVILAYTRFSGLRSFSKMSASDFA